MRISIIVSLWAATLTTLVGCGSSSPVGPVRFANAPPVWRVNDRLDVPKAPKEEPYMLRYYHFDSYYDAAARPLRLERDRRALGVNSLDEVPDSTWFTNRLGVRTLAPDEVHRGSQPGESPESHRPWTIKSSKIGGTTPGLICEDKRGKKFLLKFDQRHAPEVETSASVIGGRLAWAAGYNVPSDHVVYFKREDLVIGGSAYVKVRDKKVPLTTKDVDAMLAEVAVEPDGTIRGLASLYIDGKPIGGMERDGVRDDDPNDKIPHQHRRDQRGFAAFAAWLGHNDLKFDNTFDAWQEDPADPKRHYVVHYQLDFGKALGGMARINGRLSADYTFRFDIGEAFASLLTFGLHRQPWEPRVDPEIKGIGVFSARHYDPGGFKPNNMGHLPALLADRFDYFWGSKILIRFTRAQIAAAVEAGRLTDPRAAPYLVDTLVARQRLTARYWFRRVSPIDAIVIEQAATGGPRLCFTDLALHHYLETAQTRYTVDAYSVGGKRLATRTSVPDAVGRSCADDVPIANERDNYTVFRIKTSRGVPPVMVHVATDPATGKPRVIGLERR